MAFPVVQSTNTSNNSTSTTSHTVNLPSGIQSGDLLLMFIRYSGADSANLTISGWTATGTGGMSIFPTFYRVADGTEGSTQAFSTSSSLRSAHITYRISGFDEDDFIASALGAAGSFDPPNLTTGWGAVDTLWIPVIFGNSNGEIDTAPTDYTNLIWSTTGDTWVASSQRDLNAASEDPDAYSGTGTFTNYRTITFGIQGGAGAVNTGNFLAFM